MCADMVYEVEMKTDHFALSRSSMIAALPCGLQLKVFANCHKHFTFLVQRSVKYKVLCPVHHGESISILAPEALTLYLLPLQATPPSPPYSTPSPPAGVSHAVLSMLEFLR
ncbi:hypothetical protein AMECASPLE_007922, partial [Ameca splendens]